MSIGPLLADYFRSTQMIAPIVVGSVVLLATLWLANRLPWNRLPMWLGVGLLPVVFIASGTVTYLGMSLSIPPMSGPFSGGVFSTVFLVIVGLAVALLNGAERRQPMLEERLIVANSELATALSSANAQFRRERHQLAQVLHGVVQPRLVAQAVEQSKAEGNVNIDELLDDVTALLAKAVDEPPLVNLRDALDDLQLVWSANAEITIDLSEAVDRLVSQDPTIGKAVCDVACEAVNNAVLRGGATRVDVAAAANGGDITLCVTNPMRSAVVGEITADRGLGMTLFDAVTDSWELYQGESKTVFLAHFTSSRKLTQNERVDVIR
jgi:signal transduction histidine kinase